MCASIPLVTGELQMHGTVARQEVDDEDVQTHQKTGIACDRLRQALKKCIKDSECVQLDRRPAKECLQARDGRVPDRCYSLLATFSDCKKSMVDMRSRFRGRKGDM
ncbi:Protein Y18D10A.16 [Aphelenchoides avenae]|nr:Protein Y18D10A.16 [Aphelenchus avenae]